MYLNDIAAEIRKKVPADRIPTGDTDALFLQYAVLARAKGTLVTESDVHDAWSAWMVRQDPNHDALVRFQDLPSAARQLDTIYVDAIRAAVRHLGLTGGPIEKFADVLFPSGPPRSAPELQQALELYKIMVESSEELVNRRQSVNTFFLTINGAILTAAGFVIQSGGSQRLNGLGIFVLAAAGVILCLAWRSLISSFGQLNRGKFKVINTIEKHLKVSIYAAEWEALERGENPQVYRSFTSREIWVPNALGVVHLLAAGAALLVAFGLISLRTSTAPNGSPDLPSKLAAPVTAPTTSPACVPTSPRTTAPATPPIAP